MVDNETIIKVEKMQDDEKINDDDEVSGSGGSLTELGSGDMLMRENQDGETVTDISESGDDDKQSQKTSPVKSNATKDKAQVQV